MGVHQQLKISAEVLLDGLPVESLRVEAMYGPVNQHGELERSGVAQLEHQEDMGDSRHRYSGVITPAHSGRFGFAVRIVPGGDIFKGVHEPGLIFWDPALPDKAAVKA
jgi:starch phosphorylase